MAKTQIELELRPATVADVGLIADLETARNPEEPADSSMIAFWWTVRPANEVVTRLVAVRNGAAVAYWVASHLPWDEGARFGTMRLLLHPDIWSEAQYGLLNDRAESWLRAEGAAIGVVRVRETFERELGVLERTGYLQVRLQRQWELDLVKQRERLVAGAEAGRARMAAQGVKMLTLDRDTDPDRLAKLYEVWNEAEHDVPSTVPIPPISYDEFRHLWFDNPGIRDDRIWIAREGDAIVGLSSIEYPPQRGFAWTAFTGTAHSVRGRGIARALKYETVAQAIALGVDRVRTSNDGENAPILHLNAEMGYEPISPVLELHRELKGSSRTQVADSEFAG